MAATLNWDMALELMKTRLNRLQADHTLDAYFAERIRCAANELEATGIHVGREDGDLMLVVDYAVWQYSSRDKPDGMPDWMRLRRRERWLREGGGQE